MKLWLLDHEVRESRKRSHVFRKKYMTSNVDDKLKELASENGDCYMGKFTMKIIAINFVVQHTKITKSIFQCT